MPSWNSTSSGALGGDTVVVPELIYRVWDEKPLRSIVLAIYRRTDDKWSKENEVVIDGPSPDIELGPLAVSGDNILVGSPAAEPEETGAAHVVELAVVPDTGCALSPRRGAAPPALLVPAAVLALAIARLQSVVDWPVAAVDRKWAGLRSFAADRMPVFGADRHEAAFIWCAGQGGFGIQTAPAIAGLLAAQLGAPTPDGAIGRVDPAAYSPVRFP